jgi:hypothetical protein
VFVEKEGTAGGRFQHAVARGNLVAAESAARELTWLSLEYALDLLVLMGEQGDKRYERAAVRWLSRLLVERELELGEADLAVAGLAALTGRSNREAIALLEELIRRPHPMRR